MSPFKSKAQARYMFSQHPSIAKRWEKEGKADWKDLPENKKRKEKEKTREKAYKMLAKRK